MPTITFFRQARNDGGVRTGIEVEGQTVLSRFEGKEADDPALLWYVDVRCSGRRLPADAEGARRWLEKNSEAVAALINSLAARVPEGSDPSEWPLRESKRLTDGASIVVACSAIRRVEAREIASILRDVAAHWLELLRSLKINRAA